MKGALYVAAALAFGLVWVPPAAADDPWDAVGEAVVDTFRTARDVLIGMGVDPERTRQCADHYVMVNQEPDLAQAPVIDHADDEYGNTVVTVASGVATVVVIVQEECLGGGWHDPQQQNGLVPWP